MSCFINSSPQLLTVKSYFFEGGFFRPFWTPSTQAGITVMIWSKKSMALTWVNLHIPQQSLDKFLAHNKVLNGQPMLPSTNVKLVSTIFYKFFTFSPNDSPLKTEKCFFISSEKLISFSRYSSSCNFFPSFAHSPDSKTQMQVE